MNKYFLLPILLLSPIVMGAQGLHKGANGSVPKEEQPAGWTYYDGDEFTSPTLNPAYWFVYGSGEDRAGWSYGFNAGQGSVQNYHASQVTLLPAGKPDFVRISAQVDKHTTAPHAPGKLCWRSGALSSTHPYQSNPQTHYVAEPKKYYPLYSRIEMRAKVPYEYGVWMALWLRHIMGASMFEIDLEEVFVSSARRYHPGKYMVNQSIHGKDVEWGEKVHYNINDSAHRIRSVDFNPGADYHVYGVQIDKQTNRNGIVVTFLLDGKVRSVWQSTSKFESLLKPENMPKGEDQVWDLAITGQMGGKYLGVSYPEDNPELKGKRFNQNTKYHLDLDWVRVYKRANRPIWFGEVPSVDLQQVTSPNVQVALDASSFAKLNEKDALVLDIETFGSSPSVTLCDAHGNELVKPSFALKQGSTHAVFNIGSKAMVERLQKDGCVLRAHNVRLFIATLNTPAQTAVVTAVDMPKAQSHKASTGVYSVTGVKVADTLEHTKLHSGVYVVDGKKVIVK